MTIIQNLSGSSDSIIQPCGCGQCPTSITQATSTVVTWDQIPLHTWTTITYVDEIDGEEGKAYKMEYGGTWKVTEVDDLDDLDLVYEDDDDDEMDVPGILMTLVPGLASVVECPVCPSGEGQMMKPTCDPSLVYIVIHLNDNHEWTRDKIADWLDTLDLDLSFKT